MLVMHDLAKIKFSEIINLKGLEKIWAIDLRRDRGGPNTLRCRYISPYKKECASF